MSVHDKLVAAKKLIATPEKWTKGSYAVDAYGQPALIGDPSACAFCLGGAMLVATHDSHWDYTQMLNAVRIAVGNATFSPAAWNDWPERTHAEVIALLDKAIESAAYLEKLAPSST